jgi:hypothetical protein
MNLSGASQFNQARIEWAIRLRFSPMPNISMNWIAENLNAFRIGEMRVVGKLWETMLERDGELAVNADKRAADLAALEWQIVSDGSPDGDKHAEALTYFYNHLRATHALQQDKVGGVSELLYQMASAHSHFYSAHEMLLRVDNAAAREVTAEFRHTPIWFFESRRGFLAYLKHIFDVYGEPCVEGEWLTVVGSGWMRPLSIAFCMKAFTMRDWMIYNTRYGSGFLEGIVESQKDDPAWEEAREALRTMANDGVCLHNNGVVMKFLEQQGSKGTATFEPMQEHVDRLYAKCYRGVDLATGSRAGSSGGGQGGAQNPVGASIQSEESGIFLARDAAWASGYLQARVDVPIIRYLFDQQPRAKIVVAPPEDDTAQDDVKTMQALVPLGLPIRLKEAYEATGFTPPAAGEPCLTAPVPGSAGVPPAAGGVPPTAPNPPGATPAAATGTVALPKTADASAASTQPAWPEKAIGAGADPASLGKPQSFAPEMPDPQVDAAGFWSRAGAFFTGAVAATRRAINGPFTRNTDGTLPALATAIPNDSPSPRLRGEGRGEVSADPPQVSSAFEQAAREQLAQAVHDDMAHAAARLQFILQITDEALLKQKVKAWLADYPDMLGDILADPAAAKALQNIAATAYLQGAQPATTQLANTFDPDQPRDEKGRWADRAAVVQHIEERARFYGGKNPYYASDEYRKDWLALREASKINPKAKIVPYAGKFAIAHPKGGLMLDEGGQFAGPATFDTVEEAKIWAKKKRLDADFSPATAHLQGLHPPDTTLANWDPDQPRVPSGSPGGGQFASSKDKVIAVRDGKLDESAYAKVSPETAAKIKAATGRDVAGYHHFVDPDGLKHINDRHGVGRERQPGHEPVTAEDIEKIPDIVAHPDKVEDGGISGRGLPQVKYTKQYNGTTFYVEEEWRKEKVLAAKSMYKHSAPRKSATPFGGVSQTSKTSGAQQS